MDEFPNFAPVVARERLRMSKRFIDSSASYTQNIDDLDSYLIVFEEIIVVVCGHVPPHPTIKLKIVLFAIQDFDELRHDAIIIFRVELT